LKAAQMLLAYKTDKGKKQAQQNQMAVGQQTLQGNAQQAAQANQFKLQQMQLEHEQKMAEIGLTGQNALDVAKLKAGSSEGIATQNNMAKVAGHTINAMPESSFAPDNQPNPNQEQGVPEEEMQ
jgi:hypothetical protein